MATTVVAVLRIAREISGFSPHRSFSFSACTARDAGLGTAFLRLFAGLGCRPREEAFSGLVIRKTKDREATPVCQDLHAMIAGPGRRAWVRTIACRLQSDGAPLFTGSPSKTHPRELLRSRGQAWWIRLRSRWWLNSCHSHRRCCRVTKMDSRRAPFRERGDKSDTTRPFIQCA